MEHTPSSDAEIPDFVRDMVTHAASLAAVGAAMWLEGHNREIEPSDELVKAIKDHVQKVLPNTLNNIKEALDPGMSRVREAVFNADMLVAGAQAAKQIYGGEVE